MKFIFLLFFLSLPLLAENTTMYGPPVAFSATTVSAQALAANSKRSYLIIINTGSNMIFVKMGSAQSAHEGVPVVPGGNYEPGKASAQSVWIDTATSTSTVTLVEGNH